MLKIHSTPLTCFAQPLALELERSTVSFLTASLCSWPEATPMSSLGTTGGASPDLAGVATGKVSASAASLACRAAMVVNYLYKYTDQKTFNMHETYHLNITQYKFGSVRLSNLLQVRKHCIQQHLFLLLMFHKQPAFLRYYTKQ